MDCEVIYLFFLIFFFLYDTLLSINQVLGNFFFHFFFFCKFYIIKWIINIYDNNYYLEYGSLWSDLSISFFFLFIWYFTFKYWIIFFFFHNKGVLASSHNKYVAVKKLDNMVREVEREFKTKVIVIGQKLANLKNNKKW